MVAVFEPVWESVSMRIVNQRVVSVAPGELLKNKLETTSGLHLQLYFCPDPEMIVLYKWRGLHLLRVSQDEGIDIAK